MEISHENSKILINDYGFKPSITLYVDRECK